MSRYTKYIEHAGYILFSGVLTAASFYLMDINLNQVPGNYFLASQFVMFTAGIRILPEIFISLIARFVEHLLDENEDPNEA